MKYKEERLLALIKIIYKQEDITLDMAPRMEEVLADLTEREEKIASLRFGLEDGNNKTYKEIATIYDRTTERIRQIIIRVIRKLSHPHRRMYVLTGKRRAEDQEDPNSIKIIFSDIDGVLNIFGSPNIIEKDLVDRLIRLKESTDSEVIIVSRLGDINRINMIESLGLKIYDSIIDIKPIESKVHAVVSYIKNNNVYVKNFVVFDDMDDGYSKHFFYHFIKVNAKKGLEEKHIDKAIAILNR